MKSQKGQVLLITIMLLATVITVVMTVIYRSTTNTQLTKLQEESDRALVAAEAGLERAMRKNIGTYLFNATGLGFDSATLPGINLDKSSVEVLAQSEQDFISPLIATDQQYTFYMVSYAPETRTMGEDYYDGNITLYFASNGAGDCGGRSRPAIELTFIDKDNKISRKIIEPCSSGKYITPQDSDFITTSSGGQLKDVTFSYKADLGNINSTKLIIARVLFAGTQIGLRAMSGTLKPQGLTRPATVLTNSQLTKKIQSFQSYPQLPAEFFVTRF